MNKLVEKVKSAAEGLGEVKIMEVCGGHTHTIMRYGLRSVLPENVKLVSGPGCPVCVTSQHDIDCMIELALQGVKVATYGDMVRVPGSKMSLGDARARGADVQVVYSVDQVKEKDRVFFGIGFETTTPMTAKLLKDGFVVYSTHKTMPQAMKALAKDTKIDGFIDPGHVATITGSRAWEEMKLGIPQVIAGFSPEAIMRAVCLLLEMIKEKKARVVNDYREVVFPEGNTAAKKLVSETMRETDAEWRGLGVIKRSGLVPRKKEQDAKLVFAEKLVEVKSTRKTACRCGDVVRGLIEPSECPLFAKTCTPDNPQGACMVSQTEGACAIAYVYGRN